MFRDLIEKIKIQEEQAYFDKKDLNENDDNDFGEFVKAPGFGDSKTAYESVAEFYRFWDNFSTYKRFYWADIYSME